MAKSLLYPFFGLLLALLLVLYPLLAHLAFLPPNMGLGFIGISLFVILAELSGKIDRLGAITGGFIALYIFLGAGFPGLILLLLFFALGSFASHWKRAEKALEGLEQENKGKRTYTNALANGGVAAICGYLGWLIPEQELLFQYMLAASFAAAMADTLSSELGNIYGSRYWNILTWKPEEKGKDGVISWEGSLAGVVGGFIVAIIFALLTDWSLAILWIGLAGILGGIFDSVLGATVERKGYIGNGMVNFLNTAFAALLLLFF